MNRYPFWMYVIIAITLVLGFIYTLPNFFGEAPAVQISSNKATVRVDSRTVERAEGILRTTGIHHDGLFLDNTGLRIRLPRITDGSGDAVQRKLQDILEKELNPDQNDPVFTIALNFMPSSPRWLYSIGALPMNLGLDLRGGVHFLLQVDMQGALSKRLDSTAVDIRTHMRNQNIRGVIVNREHDRLVLRFRSAEARAARDRTRSLLEDNQPDFTFAFQGAGEDIFMIATMRSTALLRLQESSIQQNITTLHNRINELGVSEPIIAQQGADRIVVQLPGVQDVAEAKRLIGRTATLEVRMVDEEAMRTNNPAGADVVMERRADGSERPVFLQRQVILTGDRFVGADATFDQHRQPAVSVRLDSVGGRVMREVTRENIKRQMAIILYERGVGEAISVATIQGEFGNQFQITGNFSTEETVRLSILIRAGALAAPMEFIEERTIGPSLGAESIAQGFTATWTGLLAVTVFMIAYYRMFGVISVIALTSNLLFLIALLSLLQATLTLPGIAALALTLGMAIDANVLINERIREELRAGASPHLAIHEGYERAFDTILDLNVTSLIASVALLIFGSGPVRGFAVVHSIGILTSMYSSVVVSRALVNLIYGRRRKLESLSVGQVWKPDTLSHPATEKR